MPDKNCENVFLGSLGNECQYKIFCCWQNEIIKKGGFL